MKLFSVIEYWVVSSMVPLLKFGKSYIHSPGIVARIAIEGEVFTDIIRYRHIRYVLSIIGFENVITGLDQ